MKSLKQRIIKKRLDEANQIKDGRIVINQVSCDGCGVCSTVCPHSAIELKSLNNQEIQALPFKGRIKVRIKGNRKAFIPNENTCTSCGKCMNHCHEFAINKVERITKKVS